MAYLYAYWFSFGINVFEFLDISNIIAYSILPLIGGICSVPTFAVMMKYLGKSKIFVYTYAEIKADWPKIRYARLLHNLAIYLICFIIVVYVTSKSQRYYFIWLLLPIFLVYFLTVHFLVDLEWGNRFIPNRNIRAILLFAIIFLPLEGISFGKYNAGLIKSGDLYSYVDATNISKEVRKWDDDKIRYIGTMSDYFFFLLPSDKSIYIAAKEDIKPFILKRYRRQKKKE